MDIEELLRRAGVLVERNKHLNTPQAKAGARWYEIRNAEEDEAEVYIYDEIGYWGVTANEFAQELRAVTASSIRLHLNSPGGDVFAGIAIYNALKAHSATVNVQVDALAASIASVIAMAGDRIEIAKNAQMMIHDAHGFTVGTADDHREMADLLDASSDIIAEVYADRAGGTTKDWRAVMKATKWYRGAEAVEAGLADALQESTASKASGGQRTRIAAHANETNHSNTDEGLLGGFSLLEAMQAATPEKPAPTLESLLGKYRLKEAVAGAAKGGSKE